MPFRHQKKDTLILPFFSFQSEQKMCIVLELMSMSMVVLGSLLMIFIIGWYVYESHPNWFSRRKIFILILFVALFSVFFRVVHTILQRPPSLLRNITFLNHSKNSQKESSYQQSTDFSCGPAVLKYILDSVGIHTYTEKDLIQLIKANEKDGSTMWNMCQTIETIGLTAIGKKVNYEALQKEHFPLIGYYEKHFVAIVEVFDTYLKIYEPTSGKHLIMTRKDFLNIWDGYIIAIGTKKNTSKNAKAI